MRKSNDLEKIETYEVVTTGQTDGERCVNMSNALIRAGQGLSLAEKRLMASAVAMLDSMRTPRPGECPVVKISAAVDVAGLGGRGLPEARQRGTYAARASEGGGGSVAGRHRMRSIYGAVR